MDEIVMLKVLVLQNWYVLPPYIFLLVVEKFQVKNIWSLFLAGSLYGWAVEGVIVPVMYEALPWSISWTSLG
ncbi:MAG TPA: hypothetical protein HA348_07245 [Thermoplasmata archaeon]|nr:hypothetical protein [Thermoplasmata archaeon]